MRFYVFVSFVFVLATTEVIGLFDSCIHGGMKYKEGEFFLPNDTIIKTETPEQCVQCKCLQGLVLCEIENCPPLDCEAPLQNPRFCCMSCPGAAEEKKISSGFVFGKTDFKLSSKKNSKGDCLSNGKHFKNGSVWQPVIGPFGVMACVQCRCLDGNIICARLECGDLLCSQPRRELGQCCPVCPALAESKRKAFCLPKLSEVFVFKTPNVRNNSDRIEYVFVENKRQSDTTVKIHSWNLRPKNLEDVFIQSVVSWKEFRKRNFQIIGSITKRRFKKYTRREKKLRNNCYTRCLTKIERLERSLVDYAVNSRDRCEDSEIDVADICC